VGSTTAGPFGTSSATPGEAAADDAAAGPFA
jgi:hypothetical protein